MKGPLVRLLAAALCAPIVFGLGSCRLKKRTVEALSASVTFGLRIQSVVATDDICGIYELPTGKNVDTFIRRPN